MTVSDIETDVRRNIQDYVADPKYTMAGELLPAVKHVLNDMWKRKRMAFCETKVLTVKPDFPVHEADEFPVSDDWVDTVINGASARLLRFNASDNASMKASEKFRELYETGIA